MSSILTISFRGLPKQHFEPVFVLRAKQQNLRDNKTSVRCGCWFVVYIRRLIYKFLNGCPFDYMAVAGIWKVGPVNRFNHTSWMTVVPPSDRPKLVRNRCVIDFFGDVFVLSCCPFDISDGIEAFVIGLSQISSFFLQV